MTLQTIILLALGVIVIIMLGSLVFSRPKRKPQTDNLYTDALDALIKGDSRAAVLKLRELVKQDSNHIMAYLQLGNILRDTAPQQAIKIHQSLTVRPNLSESMKIDIHQALAMDYRTISNFKRARVEAELILKKQRRNLWATEFLLSLMEETRQWDAAAQYAKLVQKILNETNPNQLARFQLYEGLDLLEQGKKSEALSACQKAAKMDAGFGLPHKYIGNIYEQDRDLLKAIASWEKYASRDKVNGPEIYAKIETALFDLGRFSEVEQFYRRLLEKDSGNLAALSKLANVLVEKGEVDEALTLVENALNLKNDSVHARLMKLKLSLHRQPPGDLSHQIDDIIDLVTAGNGK